jgi:hypothetical protein
MTLLNASLLHSTTADTKTDVLLIEVFRKLIHSQNGGWQASILDGDLFFS